MRMSPHFLPSTNSLHRFTLKQRVTALCPFFQDESRASPKPSCPTSHTLGHVGRGRLGTCCLPRCFEPLACFEGNNRSGSPAKTGATHCGGESLPDNSLAICSLLVHHSGHASRQMRPICNSLCQPFPELIQSHQLPEQASTSSGKQMGSRLHESLRGVSLYQPTRHS